MTMNIDQLTIFDITPQPEPAPLPIPVQSPEPQLDASPWFEYELPTVTDITSLLSVGDRVLILPAKYSSPANTPGVVVTFMDAGIVVRRRDGEGLYLRKELHRISTAGK